MRRAALLVVSCVACASPSAPQPEPVPAPAVTVPAAEAEPEPEPVVAEVESEPEPVAVPTKKQALVAARSGLKGKLAQLAPIMPLADGRAAVVWRHTAGTHACEAEVVLALLKPEADVWALESSAVLLDASTPWLDEDAPPPLAVTARAEDFDQDEESEILVRVRHPVMCPGGGPNTITSMFIYDTSPELAVALSTELDHFMDASPDEGTKAKVKHDGPDVVITYDGATNRWVYDPRADAWSLKKPEYQRWGCDW